MTDPILNRDDFRAWHESRLMALGYPERICDEFRAAREKWLSSLKNVPILKTDIQQ